MIRNFGIGAVAGGAVLLSLATAQAGGFSRGTADTDILFEPGNFAARAGVTYVSPSRKYSSYPTASSNQVGHNPFKGYVIPSVAAKLQVMNNLSCAGTYTQSFGAAGKWRGPLGNHGNKLSEEFVVDEFGLTCGVNFDLGQGKLWLLGGGYIEKFDYDLVLATGLTTRANIQLDETKAGYRLGIAYEVPDIALRGQLLYRSGTSLSPDGTATGLALAPLAANGRGDTPQSVEFRVQSGIAPGWLAMGSIKWVDWSVNQTLDLNVPAALISRKNEYYWKDGWTVSAGIGHAFNDKWSGSVGVAWDRGVSTGVDLFSDTYTLALGASYKDDWGGELRGGVGLTYLSSAVDNVATIDSGWAPSVSLNYKMKW